MIVRTAEAREDPGSIHAAQVEEICDDFRQNGSPLESIWMQMSVADHPDTGWSKLAR